MSKKPRKSEYPIGSMVNVCFNKGCKGNMRVTDNSKPGWVDAKCDKCGQECGYPTVFSIPKKEGSTQ